jgi:hypothetical protein
MVRGAQSHFRASWKSCCDGLIVGHSLLHLLLQHSLTSNAGESRTDGFCWAALRDEQIVSCDDCFLRWFLFFSEFLKATTLVARLHLTGLYSWQVHHAGGRTIGTYSTIRTSQEIRLTHTHENPSESQARQTPTPRATQHSLSAVVGAVLALAREHVAGLLLVDVAVGLAGATRAIRRPLDHMRQPRSLGLDLNASRKHRSDSEQKTKHANADTIPSTHTRAHAHTHTRARTAGSAMPISVRGVRDWLRPPGPALALAERCRLRAGSALTDRPRRPRSSLSTDIPSSSTSS